MVGIVLGMAVMIITVGVTTGFQREVRAKVTGAGSHLQINAIRQNDPKETPRIAIAQNFYPSLDTLPGVKHIQIYATKPGIIETEQDIQGVVVKGVGADHDWTFLGKHLVDGQLPTIGDTSRPIDLLLSRYLSNRLQIGTNDTITVYLVKAIDDIRPRKFRVSGLYETGLEQLDHQLVYVDIDHLQRFSQWGLQAEIRVDDELTEHGISVEGLAFGGDRNYTYDWLGTTLRGRGPHWVEIPLAGDTTLTLVVRDADGTIPDTAWVRILRSIDTPTKALVTERGGSGGSNNKYAGGFEIELEEFSDLEEMDAKIYRDHLELGLRSLSVRDRFTEIFAWLELLDTNVLVVIVLMIIVAIINMTSSLLIIILERTTMIGVLKALGSSNDTIRSIFLIDAAYILGIGIILGDILGITACLIQQKFGVITLPVESYYVDAVPVTLHFWPIVLLNFGTLAVCVLALILPSMLVSRIAPAKAIRFD